MISLCLTGGHQAAADPRLTSNRQLEALVGEAGAAEHVTTMQIGRSVQGRPIWAVRFHRDQAAEDSCVILLVGQQHGDEPAGAQALIDLIKDYSSASDSLPEDVDLWIVPRLNPDGAHHHRRRNAHDADLNRDHLVLSQPETRALHGLVRRIKPHLAIDCHEFRRDTGDYQEQGWSEWPLIMMDTANLAIMPEELYHRGVRFCVEAAGVMDAAGFNYCRYLVGDSPIPESDAELRHSTLDPDDARNGLSAYGTLSFIIESGIYRDAQDPLADLPTRVDAYRALLGTFLNDEQGLKDAKVVAERSRATDIPSLIPSNVMWANLAPRMTEVPVIEMETGVTRRVSTPAMMHDRVVKSAVTMPDGYLIHADAVGVFTELLDAHGLAYTGLDDAGSYTVQAVKLDRIEDTFDPVYKRYAGRQIVTPMPPASIRYPAGSLLIDLRKMHAVDARRAALVLEPRQLYGLYQWPRFLSLVGDQGLLPVARWFKDKTVVAPDQTSRRPSP